MESFFGMQVGREWGGDRGLLTCPGVPPPPLGSTPVPLLVKQVMEANMEGLSIELLVVKSSDLAVLLSTFISCLLLSV